MASTSASSVQRSFKYDVFLSFRGEDTRKTFVDHLYHALHQKGIIAYKDDEKIEKGERINEQLMRSIEDSRFYIIVFSKNYASSSWCLEELLKIMECQKMTEHTAYPIFYDVEPTEVRNQSGSVGKAFERFTRKRNLEDVDLEKEFDVGRWRNALNEAAGLAGMELKNTFDGHEAKFIKHIVEMVSLKLHFFKSSIDEKLVGMETRVEEIVSILETDSDDVRMIGIWGMGGGGKTTLARAVFDSISIRFDGKSFVENVREVSKGSLSGLKELQKQILLDVFNDKRIDINSLYDGKNMMKKMMPSRKVLVVLDDVDDIGQLEALAGKPTWFKPGSRIIISTRDEQVLKAHRVSFIHDISLLSDKEAICLFSRCAFDREFPIQGYQELSQKVVYYAAGLPLTITVLGSFLCGRPKFEWVDAMERLKAIPLKQTLEKLILSYDGLENDQKEIFLEVVCILKGEMKDRAIRILESCGFNAQIGLRVLEQKSLIRVSDTDGLRIHDHIEEMGWHIVRGMHPDEPSKHSRLWIKEEIEDILVNELGTKATKSIKLDNTILDPASIMRGLQKMKELRCLHVDLGYKKWKVDKVSQFLPNTLRSLHWYGYPFCCLPKTFHANKLVNLEMKGSNISQLWEGGERKILNNLRYLDISNSMLKTFDIGLTPNIERLILRGFVELHMRVKCPKLKFLDLHGCKVSNLNLGMTPHLEELYLGRCYLLQEVHTPMGCLNNLISLNLSGCLGFQYFSVDKRHASVATLELTVESLDVCPLHPNSNLPKFQFRGEYGEPLYSWSGNVEKLISLRVCACTNLESFSASICGLQHLKELTLKGSIPEVPKDLWRLESLEKISFWLREIKHLPQDLGRLEFLEELDLKDCISLRDIPDSICNMRCLKELHLRFCVRVKKLPEELGYLKCLKVLDIQGAGIIRLPQSIYLLKGLSIIGFRKQLESYGFTSFPKTLGYFDSYHVEL